jgi:hypothetical protein
MPMVSKLEDLLQSLYGYFFNSPKRHLEFTKLAKIVDRRSKSPSKCGNKVDQYVSTFEMGWEKIEDLDY